MDIVGKFGVNVKNDVHSNFNVLLVLKFNIALGGIEALQEQVLPIWVTQKVIPDLGSRHLRIVRLLEAFRPFIQFNCPMQPQNSPQLQEFNIQTHDVTGGRFYV